MMMTEADCTITHEGQTYEAGGAVVTPEGETLGHITASHKFRQWYGSMYQVTARIDGTFYTGRSSGAGMVWIAKRCANQSSPCRNGLRAVCATLATCAPMRQATSKRE